MSPDAQTTTCAAFPSNSSGFRYIQSPVERTEATAIVANRSSAPSFCSRFGRISVRNPSIPPTSSKIKHEVSKFIPSRKQAEVSLSLPSSTVIHSGTRTARAKVKVFAMDASSCGAMVLSRQFSTNPEQASLLHCQYLALIRSRRVHHGQEPQEQSRRPGRMRFQ